MAKKFGFGCMRLPYLDKDNRHPSILHILTIITVEKMQ